MATPEDCRMTLGKSVVVLWLNAKGSYTAARLTPAHSLDVLDRLLAEADAPARMIDEPDPIAAVEALIAGQAREIRGGR